MRSKKSVGLFVGLLTFVAMTIIAGCAQNAMPTASSPQDNGGFALTACVVTPTTPTPTPADTAVDTVYIGDNVIFAPVDKRTVKTSVISSTYDYGDGSNAKDTGLVNGLHQFGKIGKFYVKLTVYLPDTSKTCGIYIVVIAHKSTPVKPDTTKPDTQVVTPINPTSSFSADSAFMILSVVPSSTIPGQFVVTTGTSVSDVDCGCSSLNPFQHGYDDWSNAGVILLKSVPRLGNLYTPSRSVKPGVYYVGVGSVWNQTDKASTYLDTNKIKPNTYYRNGIFGFCIDYHGKYYPIKDSANVQLTDPFNADSAFISQSVTPSATTAGMFNVVWGTAIFDVDCYCSTPSPFQHGYDSWNGAPIMLSAMPKSANGRLYQVTKAQYPGVYYVGIGSVWGGTDNSSTYIDTMKLRPNMWYRNGIVGYCLDYQGHLHQVKDSATVQFQPPTPAIDTTVPGTYGDNPGAHWRLRLTDIKHSDVPGGKDSVMLIWSARYLQACASNPFTMTSNIAGLTNATLYQPAGKSYGYTIVAVANFPDSTGALCNVNQGTCVDNDHSGTKFWSDFYHAFQLRWDPLGLSKSVAGKSTGHLIQIVQ